MNDRGQVEAQGTDKGADPPHTGAWRCLTLRRASVGTLNSSQDRCNAPHGTLPEGLWPWVM